MSEGKGRESKGATRRLATAVGLLYDSKESMSAAFRRISDRRLQDEVSIAGDMIFRTLQHLLPGIPEEYLQAASVRNILEQFRILRDKIEEAEEERREGKMTILDFLPEEFVVPVKDIARLAEFYIHNIKDKVEPPDIVA